MMIIDRGTYETQGGHMLRFEHQQGEHDRFVCRDKSGFTIETAENPAGTFAEFIGETITKFLSASATVGKATV